MARRPGLAAAPMLALTALVVGVPLVLLVTYAFRESSFAGVGPGPTLDQFRDLFESATVPRLMLRTALVALTVAATVTACAFVIAYAVTFRLRRRAALAVLGVVLAAGMASFLVRVYAWGTILGREGLTNSALERTGLIDAPLEFIFFGYFSVILTMTYVYLPLGVLMVQGAMNDVDRHSIEAARVMGAGRWRTAFGVVAPQVRSGLLASFALVTVLSSADYVTPRIVGGIKGQMLGSLIRDRAVSAADLPGGASVALVFVVFLLLLAVALAVLWRGARALMRLAGPRLNLAASRLAARAPDRLARRSLSRPAAIALMAFLLLPTLTVVVFSVNQSSTLGLPWRGFTLDWYGDVLDRQGFGNALSTSLELLAVALIGALLLGVPCAFALHRASGRWRRVLNAVVVLPFVVPGVLLGLGLLAVADDQQIRLGLPLTAAAHVLLIAPVVVLVVLARLSTMNPELTQAARVMGSSPARAFRTVSLPLIAPSLVGAALIGAAVSLDEVFITTFTIGTDSTLPIWLFSQARVGFDPGLNALGVMFVAATLVLLAVAALFLRGAARRAPGPAGGS